MFDDEEIKEKVCRILDDLPDENAWLDYKLRYDFGTEDKIDFVKDLCAFVNSSDSYGSDKFIIVGVADRTKFLKGLNCSSDMPDDNEFQKLADCIYPKVKIRTGLVKYYDRNSQCEKTFGYVYIPSSNNNRVYGIDRWLEYKKEGLTSLDDKEGRTLYPSTAWIRRGSAKFPLTEYERRDIYEADRKRIVNFDNMFYLNAGTLVGDRKIMKALALFGGWDDDNENDKKLLSEFIGMPYAEWIEKVRAMANSEDSSLLFNGNRWKVGNRKALLAKYAGDFYREDIDKFKNAVKRVLSEKDSRLYMIKSENSLSDIYSKSFSYSDTLRESVAETLPIVVSCRDEFLKVKDEIRNLPVLVVREIFENSDWGIWGSIGNLLPLLAESAPAEFMRQIDVKIGQIPSLEKDFVTLKHYMDGLYDALGMLAWNPTDFLGAYTILANLAEADDAVVDRMVQIVLPWLPQTKASIDERAGVLQEVLKEHKKIGWQILKKTMPNQMQTSAASLKPRWNNIVSNEDEKVSTGDYWMQVENYLNIMLKNVRTDTRKFCDLIDLIDSLPYDLTKKIMSKLNNDQVLNLPECRRYVIWDYLEDMIARAGRFSKSGDNLEKLIMELKMVSEKLKPKDVFIYARRFFRRDSWNLLSDKRNYEAEEKELYFIRLNLLDGILRGGVDRIIDFAREVEDPYAVGFCLAEIIGGSFDDEAKILDGLNRHRGKLFMLAGGFVRGKFDKGGYNWVKQLNFGKWSKNARVNLLLFLPLEGETFGLVEKLLGQQDFLYWKKVDIRAAKNETDLNYICNNLMNAGRPERAIGIIAMGLLRNESLNYDRKIAIGCLKNAVKGNEYANNGVLASDITRVICDLQKSNVSKDIMSSIEWSYLPILNNEFCRPITIERMISSNPETYDKILRLAFSGEREIDKDNNRDRMSINAHRLLERWRMVPGEVEGKIDKQKLNNWYKKMRTLCLESGMLEFALRHLGEVFFYAPVAAKGDFWIDDAVAKILNEKGNDTVRRGFNLRAVNSVGAVSVDSEGSAYLEKKEEYIEKAEQASKKRYYNFASSLRQLAENFEWYAGHTADWFDRRDF